MPYFKWRGVDISGSVKRGKHPAHSPQELSDQLFKRGIALLQCRSVYTPSFLWSINARVKGDLFRHKAQLLRAGIMLPKVLAISAEQSNNPFMYEMLFDVGLAVQQGVPFAAALNKQQALSDPIVAIMLTAGQESGNFVNALENVALYFHKQHAFNKSVRAALAMPFLTLLFFIGISCFIFILIIPRFAEMFQSLQQELPSLTRNMIAVSDFMRSSSMVWVVSLLIIVIVGAHYYCSTVGKKTWSRVMMGIPFVGHLIWQHQLCQALQALSLLINSGVTLVAGLKIISDAVDNERVKVLLNELHHEVASGQLLSNAMSLTSLFLPEVIALIHVGQESGTLGQSLEAAAFVYSDKLDHSMRRLVFFLQPVVIIMLGLLVTTLIFAVYLPIMQLSHVL